MNKLKEVLEELVFQFAPRGVKTGKPIIWTGGLSALEGAFEALGWDDPHYLPEEGYTCEIKGCMEVDTCGVPWGDLFLCLCSDHYMDSFHGKERPPVKAYALRREATRGKDGIPP